MEMSLLSHTGKHRIDNCLLLILSQPIIEHGVLQFMMIGQSICQVIVRKLQEQ